MTIALPFEEGELPCSDPFYGPSGRRVQGRTVTIRPTGPRPCCGHHAFAARLRFCFSVTLRRNSNEGFCVIWLYVRGAMSITHLGHGLRHGRMLTTWRWGTRGEEALHVGNPRGAGVWPEGRRGDQRPSKRCGRSLG